MTIAIDSDNLVQQALAKMQSGNAHESMALCEQVLLRTPLHLAAQKTAAVACAMGQRYAQAAQFCEQVLQQEGPSVDVLRNYANVLLALGRSDHALAQIDRALALDPQQAVSHHTLGTFHARMRHWESAAQAFRNAIRCDPGFLPAHLALCQTLIDGQRFGEVVLPLQDALAMFPDEAQLYLMMSNALARCGETDKARECLSVALARQPAFAPARSALNRLAFEWEQPITGRRVCLRRRREDDAQFLANCYGNPGFGDRVARYFTKESDIFSLAFSLRREQATHPLVFGALHWIVEDRLNGAPIGLAGISDLQTDHNRGEYFVGIFNDALHGTGWAVEASLLALDFAFNVVGLHKLTSQVYDNNLISQKSTLALGFTQESYLRAHYRHPGTGQYFGMYGNGLLQSEFHANARISRLALRLLGRNITQNNPASD